MLKTPLSCARMTQIQEKSEAFGLAKSNKRHPYSGRDNSVSVKHLKEVMNKN